MAVFVRISWCSIRVICASPTTASTVDAMGRRSPRRSIGAGLGRQFALTAPSNFSCRPRRSGDEPVRGTGRIAQARNLVADQRQHRGRIEIPLRARARPGRPREPRGAVRDRRRSDDPHGRPRRRRGPAAATAPRTSEGSAGSARTLRTATDARRSTTAAATGGCIPARACSPRHTLRGSAGMTRGWPQHAGGFGVPVGRVEPGPAIGNRMLAVERLQQEFDLPMLEQAQQDGGDVFAPAARGLVVPDVPQRMLERLAERPAQRMGRLPGVRVQRMAPAHPRSRSRHNSASLRPRASWSSASSARN